jgi:hypothetical protein
MPQQAAVGQAEGNGSVLSRWTLGDLLVVLGLLLAVLALLLLDWRKPPYHGWGFSTPGRLSRPRR